MTKSLLIVDDEPNMRHMLKALLSKHSYRIDEAENGQQALTLANENRYDYILCDIKMPVLDGIAFLKESHPFKNDTTIIMMSAYGSIEQAIEAMKFGAYDYISKPFKTDEVLLTLKKAEERKQLQKENRALKREIRFKDKRETFVDVVGSSPSITELIQLSEKVACYDTSVLITGESGTGKELIARGIHNHSPRSANPLITVNCASIPRELLESEFFGYGKGAFTGAESNKTGLLKEAHGGTLFLDEIGELPLDLQAKLLRVLQDGEIRALGTNTLDKVDIRLVAATAKILNEEVKLGNFRQDLFFRLNVVELIVPPLRDRLQDLPLLVDYFIEQFQIKIPNSVSSISKDTLQIFLNHRWEGNIRELKNVIEHAMIYCDGREIQPKHLPSKMITSVDSNGEKSDFNSNNLSIKQGRVELERRLIIKALEETKGNKTQAAELLELSYPSLLAKIKEYAISN